MVTPFVPSIRCPRAAGLIVVTPGPSRTHRRQPLTRPRSRGNAAHTRTARTVPGCTRLQSARGLPGRDVKPEGRPGMMGGLEPQGESVSVDTSVPHIARVYDYWLGGKDNFAVDRTAAE